MNLFQEPIQLFIASFLNNCFFSKNQNELPLVVVSLQEKIAILSKKLSISIWAKNSNYLETKPSKLINLITFLLK